MEQEKSWKKGGRGQGAGGAAPSRTGLFAGSTSLPSLVIYDELAGRAGR